MIFLPLVGKRFLPSTIADFFHVVAILPLLNFFIVNLVGRTTYKAGDLWGLFNGIRMVWICYGVIYPHPRIAKHTSYSMLIATWCIQNLIDNAYHGFKVKTKTSPMWLFRMHHLHFYITVPLAMLSEMILIFLSGTYEKHHIYELFLDAVLLSYIPIGFLAFRHLLARKHEKYDKVLEKRRLGRTTGVGLETISALQSSPINEHPSSQTVS